MWGQGRFNHGSRRGRKAETTNLHEFGLKRAETDKTWKTRIARILTNCEPRMRPDEHESEKRGGYGECGALCHPWCVVELLRKGAGVAVVAGEVGIFGINVEEDAAFGAELFEGRTAALGEDDVAGVATARLDLLLAVVSFVQAVVAA